MENKRLGDALIKIYFSAVAEIILLQDFCDRNLEDLINIENDVNKNYGLGKKIYDAFLPILKSDNLKDMNKNLSKVNECVVFGKIKFKDICKVSITNKDKSIVYEMKPEYDSEKYDPNIAIQKFKSLITNQKIFIGAILSNIIIIFESATSKILKLLYCINPPLYFQNRTMSIAAACDNYEKSIIAEVEKAVNNDMYESIKVFKLLEKNESININRFNTLKSRFEEIYYRRNVYVHNNGIANKQYLDKVNQTFSRGIKNGDFLACDLDYLNNAMQCLSEIIFTIVFSLMEKNKIKDEHLIRKIDHRLFQILKDKKYTLCKFPYYVLSQYKDLLGSDKIMFKINYLNCKKQLGFDIGNELNDLDDSPLEIQYKIAKECLLNHNEIVMKKLEEIYPKYFSASEIKEWPIFIDFRKTKFYKKFVANHKEDFSKNAIVLKKQY